MLMSALNRATPISAPRQALTTARKPVSDDLAVELEGHMMAAPVWKTWFNEALSHRTSPNTMT
jgi:hypothetical protein